MRTCKIFAICLLWTVVFSFADDCFRLKSAEWKDVPTVSEFDNVVAFATMNGCNLFTFKELKNEVGKIRFAAVQKKTKADEGRILWARYSVKKGAPDRAYIDSNGDFFAAEGTGRNGIIPPTNLKTLKIGSLVSTVAPNSSRILDSLDVENSIVSPLTLEEVSFNALKMMRSIAMNSGDGERIVLASKLEGLSFIHVKKVMDVGFKQIFLAIEDTVFELTKTEKDCFGLAGSNINQAGRCFTSEHEALLYKSRNETKNASEAAYELMKKQKFTKDSDKVLKDVRDGQIYKVVKIGIQIWMAENLNYDAPKSVCAGNKKENCRKYGRLYPSLYYENSGSDLCPEGWKTPDIDDWDELFKELGAQKECYDMAEFYEIYDVDKKDFDADRGKCIGFDWPSRENSLNNVLEKLNKKGFGILWAGDGWFEQFGKKAYFASLNAPYVCFQKGESFASTYSCDQDPSGMYSVRCVKDGEGTNLQLENTQAETASRGQTKNPAEAAYELMKKQKKDFDKLLEEVAGLQTTGKTVLEGRNGKVPVHEEEIHGGLLGGGPPKAKGKDSIKTPSMRDSDMGAGGASRSAADIMKLVHQRTPLLGHIYNKYLKKKPGFQGKITLRFTIAPGGEIISISNVSSTTGYAEFDNEIKNAVSRWTFSKVKSGNTTVTIPFTFQE